MSTQMFDALARRAAAGLSRRRSLFTLGGAALAATIAIPELGQAKKKKGKDCKKKEKQRCNNDAADCISTLQATGDCDAVCLALLTPCCEECSANGFLICFLAASAP
jgi:hypothetical protein